MKIGFYDSGIGGVKLLNDVIEKGVKANFVMLGDNKYFPYGTKTKEEVIDRARKCVSYLVSEGCKLIVIACNTATSCALLTLKEEFKDITFIGTEPNIADAISDENHKKVLVLATTITVSGDLIKKRINDLNANDDVILMKADELVRLVQSEDFENNKEKVDNYLKNVLSNFKDEEISHIVLGCTHFPCVNDNIIRVMGNNVKILDSSSNLALKLKENGVSEGSTSIKVLCTKDEKSFTSAAKSILSGKDITVEVIDR